MSDSTLHDNQAAGRRKQARRTVLVLSLMVLAVGLAWAGGRIVESRLVAARRGQSGAIRSGPATRPESDTPFGLDNPLAESGLVPFDGAPAGVAPPRGCRRLYGFQRRNDLDIERQVSYEMAGEPDAAAGHYAGQLTRLGYQVLEDRAGPDGRRTLVFGKLDGWVTVSLRKDARNAKMVSIVVVAVAPTSPTAPATPTKR
jgi:hypothetical protein